MAAKPNANAIPIRSQLSFNINRYSYQNPLRLIDRSGDEVCLQYMFLLLWNLNHNGLQHEQC